MSKTFHGAYALTGGATGALDAIDGAGLADKDGAVVITQAGAYIYALDVDSAATASSPNIIEPVANAGDKRWILQSPGQITLNEDLDAAGYYALQLQNIPDLASKGPSYWFDGVDGKISLGTTTALNPRTGDFSIVADIKNTGNDGTQNVIWSAREAGAVDDRLDLRINTDGYLILHAQESDTQRDTVANKTNIGADGQHHVVALTIDRDVNPGTKLYVDGGEETYSLHESITVIPGDINPGGTKYIGIYAIDGTSLPFAGDISRFLIFNLNLTPTEVKALSSGESVPFKYGPNATDKAGELRNSGDFVVGAEYIITTYTDGDFQSAGAADDNVGTRFTATATATGVLDGGDTATRLGCTLQLEQDGITGTEWIDKSGNGYEITNSGVVPVNLEVPTPIYIPAVEFEITTGTSAEINGTGIHGHSMTDNELSTLSYKPLETFDIDVNRLLYVQVVWCCIDGTTANGVTWLVTYDHDSFESGVLTAPATALDTVIVEDNENDAPYTIQKTAKGIIDAGNLTFGVPIAFRVEADVVDSGNDPGCWFMGLLLSQ